MKVNLPEFRKEGRLVLKEWMRHRAFLHAFERIDEPCIEVFWTAPVSAVSVANRITVK
jgi:hypothetical protein